jgi:hypothetical protein
MNVMESYDWLWPGLYLGILCPWVGGGGGGGRGGAGLGGGWLREIRMKAEIINKRFISFQTHAKRERAVT